MKNFTSYEEFKRQLYLWMIPPVVIAMFVYNIMMLEVDNNEFVTSVTMIVLLWLTVMWFFVYKRRYFRVAEISTLIIIVSTHLALFYHLIFIYMGKGMVNGIAISLIWFPGVILVYFLILKAKWGTVLSLIVLFIDIAMGIINFHHLTIQFKIDLIQLYVALLFYIFIFYLTQYSLKTISQMESIKKYAFRDALTGIANRRQMDLWLEKLVNRANDKHKTFSIIFFDIDHFKIVNDTYGHKVGDSVLIELAMLVTQSISQDDLFGRWGGEEFIILTEYKSDYAVELAEELRMLIEENKFTTAEKQTVSFGVTDYRISETVDELLFRVDQGLYQSKQNGRNQVTKV